MANDTKAPTVRYPIPFASASAILFSFPERSNETIKPVKNSTAVVRIRPLVELKIPVLGMDGKATGVSVLSTLWRERKSTPEGEQETFSFSISDRQIVHSYLNYTPKSDDYYAARDVYNGWRHEVVDAALTWFDKQPDARRDHVGGSVARLVKKATTDTPPAAAPVNN